MVVRFQFLGIPPKGEHLTSPNKTPRIFLFPISRDPPEGGTPYRERSGGTGDVLEFPISRDPPEGGTASLPVVNSDTFMFPISRDPPEGGTQRLPDCCPGSFEEVSNF